jgi:hypothetical protein
MVYHKSILSPGLMFLRMKDPNHQPEAAECEWLVGFKHQPVGGLIWVVLLEIRMNEATNLPSKIQRLQV